MTIHTKNVALRPGGLSRALSSVSVDDLAVKDTSGRVKRVKVLDEAQREAISKLTDASQIPHSERKRQWGALKRRLDKEDTLPPGVLAKWEHASTPQQKSAPQFFENKCVHQLFFLACST